MAELEGVTVVLVVSTDARRAESTARVLRGEGHQVVVANSFEKARALLTSSPPDLLITDIQLGAYNGLQLVWQRHFAHPEKPSIVTSTYADPVLETEARRLGCPYLISPFEPLELLTAVGIFPRLSRGDHDTSVDKRIWPRTLVGPELRVDMEPGLATIVDVSYGGCRLRFPDGAEIPMAGSVNVPIPTLDRVIEGTPVWRESVYDNSADIYGIAVTGPLEAEQAWRQFVDAVGSA